MISKGLFEDKIVVNKYGGLNNYIIVPKYSVSKEFKILFPSEDEEKIGKGP